MATCVLCDPTTGKSGGSYVNPTDAVNVGASTTRAPCIEPFTSVLVLRTTTQCKSGWRVGPVFLHTVVIVFRLLMICAVVLCCRWCADDAAFWLRCCCNLLLPCRYAGLLGLLCRWFNHGRHREAQENAHTAAARTWRSAC